MESEGKAEKPMALNGNVPQEAESLDDNESVMLKPSVSSPLTPIEEQHNKEIEDIISLLPTDQTIAYMEAQRFSRDLICHESEPSKFLRRYSGDVEAAARAIATYWSKRKELYGDRFLLSLNLTEDGALNSEDLKVLESCGVMNLPVDLEGRSVLCFDLSKLEKDMYSLESILRVYFYMLQVVSENEKTQSEGVVIIIIVHSAYFHLRLNSLLQFAEQTHPMRAQAVHVVFRPSDDAPKAIFLETVQPSVLQSCVDMDVKDRLFFHFLETADNHPPATLQDAGLVGKNVPTCIRGSWTDFDHQRWRMTRVALESAKQASVVANNLGDASFTPSRKRRKQSTTTQYGEQANRDLPKICPPLLSEAGPLPSTPDRDAQPGHTDPCRIADIENAISSLSNDSNFKQAYMEALEQNPDLVYKETNPIDFLVASKFDVGRAALRLVSNWKKRKELFEKRAFLPMTQTGEGALSRGDLAALSSGILLALPNDSKGRAVIHYDSSKAGEANRDSLRRVAFYMISVASEVSAAQDRGLVILMSVENVNDMFISACSFVDILEVIPCQVEALHIICFQALSQEPSTTRGQFENFANAAFGAVPEKKLIVHMDFSRTEALEKLDGHGLIRVNLPKAIGGCWGVERFVEWCELRTRYEWGLPPAASHKGVDKVFDFSNIKPPSQLVESDRIERARRMNVLHSRRKRERERIEIEVLHEQADDLRSQNSELKRENDRLEVLLLSTQRLVDHQARYPQQELHSYPFLDPKGMFTAESGNIIQRQQPSTAQVDQSVTCGIPSQSSVPQGQLMMTAAPGAPYCLMPTGSAALAEKVQPRNFPMQHVSFFPQQPVIPLVNFHYPSSAPFLMPVPLACQSAITLPQSTAYSLPIVTATGSYSHLDTSANGSIIGKQNVARRIPGEHIDEA